MTSPLADRLGALAPTDDDSDWLDVRRRARRRGRTPIVLAAAAVAAALAVAPAFGLHRIVLDFFSGDPAPPRIQLDFERMGIGAPRGMAPGIIPGETRRVPVVGDGARHQLWVAPTQEGGFCFLWENQVAACHAEREGGPLSVGWRGNQWMERVYGEVISATGDQVELRYADGKVSAAPITWVSEPIDAGFFYAEVPERHQQPETRLVEVVLLDGDDVVGRQRAPYGHPLMEDNPATGLPKAAVYDERRELVTISTSDGKEVSAMRAPSRLGGHCTWLARDDEAYRAFFGCQTEAQQERQRPSGLGLSSGSQPILFWVHGQRVASVELRFEDGATRRLDAVEGVVLAEIDPARYERGRRLVEAVAYDALGMELARNTLDPSAHGVYPCEEPVDIGAGMKACP
jgi:hypothetical protein